jgi:hypothetical protein
MKDGASTTNMSSVRVGRTGARAAGLTHDDGAFVRGGGGGVVDDELMGMGVIVALMFGGYMPWAGSAMGKSVGYDWLTDDDDDLLTGTGPRPDSIELVSIITSVGSFLLPELLLLDLAAISTSLLVSFTTIVDEFELRCFDLFSSILSLLMASGSWGSTSSMSDSSDEWDWVECSSLSLST